MLVCFSGKALGVIEFGRGAEKKRIRSAPPRRFERSHMHHFFSRGFSLTHSLTHTPFLSFSRADTVSDLPSLPTPTPRPSFKRSTGPFFLSRFSPNFHSFSRADTLSDSPSLPPSLLHAPSWRLRRQASGLEPVALSLFAFLFPVFFLLFFPFFPFFSWIKNSCICCWRLRGL